MCCLSNSYLNSTSCNGVHAITTCNRHLVCLAVHSCSHSRIKFGQAPSILKSIPSWYEKFHFTEPYIINQSNALVKHNQSEEAPIEVSRGENILLINAFSGHSWSKLDCLFLLSSLPQSLTSSFVSSFKIPTDPAKAGGFFQSIIPSSSCKADKNCAENL